MRAQRLTLWLLLLSLVGLVCAQPELQLRYMRRDDPAAAGTVSVASSSASATPASSAVTSSARPDATTTPPPHSASASGSSHATSSTVSLSSISLQATMTSATFPTFTAAPSNSTDAADQLPLQPGITPALAVAGVLLLGTGLAYTFIGIQRKWLYIGWSVMYLVSIAITVLLVFVASPPVTNGVQGGYFIAAFLPGCLIAALSTMIFPEVVEGFACLLGGFCLAMWFLCLAPNGLIQSQGGRIGLMIGLSVAAYSLYFSHWTRTYGLIVCISFSGATALVLGVDCFSQAGLKEFWVYIWNLNPRLFPLGIDTYPVTRGIKVEEALIVVLTAFGVVSQFKLWNVIKERRQRKAQARLQDEEDREHLEANLGRQIEKHNQTEKARWEAVYGDKAGASSVSIFHSVTDSTYDVTGRSKAGSYQGSVVELTDLGDHARGDIVMRAVSAERQQIHHERKNTLDTLDPAGVSVESGAYVETVNRVGDRTRSGQPGVNPLPFRIPTNAEALDVDRDDANSLTTADGGHLDDSSLPARPVAVRKAHSQHIPAETRTDHDSDLEVPHDDDKASSVDATLNELSENEDDETQHDRRPNNAAVQSTPESAPGNKQHRRRRSASQPDKSAWDAAQLDAKRKSMPAFEELEKAQAAEQAGALYAKATNLSEKLGLKQKGSASVAPADPAEAPSRRVSLKKEFLPKDMSGVAQIYRTNEWAKHIFDADQPEMDQLNRDKEDAVGVAYNTEKAAPLNMDELQLTATTGQPMARAPSQTSMTRANPRRQLQRSVSAHSQDALADRGRASSRSRDPSPGRAVMRASSSRSRSRLNLVTAFPAEHIPEEELNDNFMDVHSSAEPHSASTPHSATSPHPPTGKTLLGQRVEKLRSRISTTSFANNGADSADHPGLQRSTSMGFQAPSRTSNVYSNFDEPSSGTPQLTARSSVDLRKQGPIFSAAGTPKHSARVSVDAKGRSVSSPSFLTPYDSQRVSVDGSRLAPIPDADDDDNISLASRRQNLQAAALQDDDVPLSQRREMIRRASMNSATGSPYAPSGSPASFQVQSPGLIYDSHQPQRGSSVNQATRDSRLAEWRAGMARDASRDRGTGQRISRQQEDNMQRIMEERKMTSEVEQRRAAERAAFDRSMEERMRTGSMM